MPAQLQLFESRDVSQRWNVRVSRRARRLSVRVYPGGQVEVVVPPGASATTVHKFVHSHRDWIDRRVADLSASAPKMIETRPQTIELRALERVYSLAYSASSSRLMVKEVSSQHWLIVSGPTGSDREVGVALRNWLQQTAHEALGLRLRAVADACGFDFQRLQVRRQRTRWGSCSSTGTISLNICLLFLDPAVVRYLLIHELCHTRHMNHSNRFWSLVETHEPDYKRLDRELVRGWQSVPGWVFA
jgi:predicted metal-dependent hydrolase